MISSPSRRFIGRSIALLPFTSTKTFQRSNGGSNLSFWPWEIPSYLKSKGDK